jgi:hypothetical protein
MNMHDQHVKRVLNSRKRCVYMCLVTRVLLQVNSCLDK